MSSLWAENSGGWYPREVSKGDMLVVELVRVVGVLNPRKMCAPG